jgi:cell division protein DivIC
MNFGEVWVKSFPLLRNKYVLTGLVFMVWLFFFDQNNLLNRLNDIRTLKKLEEEKVYYEQKIKDDQLRLRELKTDSENLEKFAREQYLMKKSNEDIFVIVEK